MTLTRIVFPYIFFMGAAALGTGLLNAHQRFAVPALAPALLNVVLIAAPFMLVAPCVAMGLPPIASLSVAAIIGGVLQMIAQWPALARLGAFSLPKIDLSDACAPRDHVARAAHDRAGDLPGERDALASVHVVPAGGLAELPLLRAAPRRGSHRACSRSRSHRPRCRRSPICVHAERTKSSEKVFAFALRSSLFIGVPSTVILVALAEPIVSVLFQRGAFDHHDALETARSLARRGAGVWAIACVRVVVPMFYAHADTRTPLAGGAANLVAFVALALLLRGPMGHAGIGLAISAAGIVQFGVLLILLRRKLGRLGLGVVAASAARVGVAAIAMGAAGWGVARFGHWERGGNDLGNFVVLALALTAASIAYVIVLAVLRAPELDDGVAAIRRRLRR